jgi:hypothetical protein
MATPQRSNRQTYDAGSSRTECPSALILVLFSKLVYHWAKAGSDRCVRMSKKGIVALERRGKWQRMLSVLITGQVGA